MKNKIQKGKGLPLAPGVYSLLFIRGYTPGARGTGGVIPNDSNILGGAGT